MIIDEITKKISNAMVEKDQTSLNVFRSIMSEIQNKKIELRKEEKDISDDDVLKIIHREAKKRKDAIVLYVKGNRKDLAEKEENELKLIEKLLPTALTDDELIVIVDEVMESNNFKSKNDFGNAMKNVMSRVGSGSDGTRVSKIINNKLK